MVTPNDSGRAYLRAGADSSLLAKAQCGTYVLILYCPKEQQAEIGKLGPLPLRRGFYVYVGSAFGPGGVRARVGHHQKLAQRPHWHIDYLRRRTRLDQVWYCYDRIHREHQWARVIQALSDASIPITGFGSSDCKCKTHLFFFARRPAFAEFRRKAQRLLKGIACYFDACAPARAASEQACGYSHRSNLNPILRVT